jgi:hypothetical protein
MNLDQARQSYRNDAMFRGVVDTITSWILAMNVTPAEARAAAMLASMRVEEIRPKSFYISEEPR